MRKINLYIIFFCTSFLWIENVNASIVPIDSDLEIKNIAPYIQTYSDTSCNRSIDFLIENLNRLKFEKHKEDYFNYDQVNSCPWVRVQITNISVQELQFYLRVDNHKISIVDWYVFNNGKLHDHILTGDDLKFSQRPILDLDYLLPIQIAPADTLDCFLKLYRGTNIISTNLFIESKNHFIGFSANEKYQLGIFVGISFFFVVIAFVIALLFRTKLLFIYLLMVVTMFFYCITSEGLGYQYLWGNSSKFIKRLFGIGLPVIQLFSFMFFGILYFKTKELHQRYHKVLRGLIIFLIGLIVIGIPLIVLIRDSFFWYKFISRILVFILNATIIVVFFVTLIISIQEYKRAKSKSVLAYIAVIIVYLILLMSVFLHLTGIFPDDSIVKYSLFPGFIFEMAALTFIIIQGYQIELKEKEKLEFEYNQNQVKLVNALLEGEEQERQRVASDLHDSLGSLLSISKLYLSQVKIENRDEVEKWLNKAQTETRRISNALMPKVLFTLGLVPAIKDMCERNELAEKIAIGFVKNDLVFDYSDFQKINIYRLVEELLNVAIIESCAKKITIQLTEFDEELNLIIEDNGNGKLKDSFFERSGKNNIPTRVQALDGEMIIDSTEGRGTSVVIDFLLTKDDELVK